MALLTYLLMIGAEHFDTIVNSTQHLTVIFNTFVLCQVFNELNARSIGDEVLLYSLSYKICIITYFIFI